MHYLEKAAKMINSIIVKKAIVIGAKNKVKFFGKTLTGGQGINWAVLHFIERNKVKLSFLVVSLCSRNIL